VSICTSYSFVATSTLRSDQLEHHSSAPNHVCNLALASKVRPRNRHIVPHVRPKWVSIAFSLASRWLPQSPPSHGTRHRRDTSTRIEGLSGQRLGHARVRWQLFGLVILRRRGRLSLLGRVDTQVSGDAGCQGSRLALGGSHLA